MFISPSKYRDKSNLEFHRWISSGVEPCVLGVGWAVPTFNRGNQQYLVGTAHPTIRNFRNIRLKSTEPKNFKGQLRSWPAQPVWRRRLFPSFFKVTQYLIRCWAFDAYSPPPEGSMFDVHNYFEQKIT
jgi:hypothetical protein